jgi:hypothetical protein
MTYGPMQLVVLRFEDASIPVDVVNLLRRLRDQGVVRMVDAMFVSKDLHGELSAIKATDVSGEEAVLLGTRPKLCLVMAPPERRDSNSGPGWGLPRLLKRCSLESARTRSIRLPT